MSFVSFLSAVNFIGVNLLVRFPNFPFLKKTRVQCFTKEISGTDDDLCQTLGKEIKYKLSRKREGE